MLEKPDLQDQIIITALRESYGLGIAGIEFLPLGYDATAWVYRVHTADGQRYFLKVKSGNVSESSVTVPRYLKDQGIEQVVAPLLTRTRALWTAVDRFTLILYPFVEGRTGMEIGMSDSQWTELGVVLKAIHSTSFPVEKETFSPKWSGTVRALQAKIKQRNSSGDAERELASFWKDKSTEIGKIVDRADELGRILQQTSPELVLCHTDIHTANVLLDKDGRLHIVDWDSPLRAPKERDLMFVVVGIEVATRQEESFFRGYGSTVIDSLALAYYRYEWVVQEFGDFGERVFLTPDTGELTRNDAVQGFRKLFEPGDVVEEAYQSDRQDFAASRLQ